MMRWFKQPPPRGVLLLLLAAGLAVCFAIEQFGLVDDYVRFVLITLGINIILCVSLNLVNGWMGEFSVGHAGFMALGAYLSACVSVKWLGWGDPLWMFPLAVVAGGVSIPGLAVPDIAWPWFVVIGGGINIAVSWTASVLIDGFKPDWHPYSVPGQIRAFREKGLPETQDGWSLVPGRIDPPVWGLLIFFAATIIFLLFAARLGGS
jgi:branched-subunit amino acid ABC-type transport system permease component